MLTLNSKRPVKEIVLIISALLTHSPARPKSSSLQLRNGIGRHPASPGIELAANRGEELTGQRVRPALSPRISGASITEQSSR